MNVRKFTARTTREAMAKVRQALGDDAVVLKNRSVDGGVEIMAMSDEALGEQPTNRPAARPTASPGQAAAPAVVPADAPRGDGSPADDMPAWAAAGSAPEPMSTLTFQQFVRDRLARRRTSAVDTASPVPQTPSPVHMAVDSQGTDAPAMPDAPAVVVATPEAPGNEVARGAIAGGLARARSALDGAQTQDSGASRLQQARLALAQTKQRLAQSAMPSVMRAGRAPPAEPLEPDQTDFSALPAGSSETVRFGMAEPAPSLSQVLGQPQVAMPAKPAEAPAVMAELREMRGLISNQLSSLAWLDGVRRNPLQVRLLRNLISCGLSAQLARKLVSRVPPQLRDQQAHAWVRQMLSRLLRCDVAGSGLLDRGGMYALVGPTGVGKTTSAAKIAAQFALRHGVQSVGLLTVDAYRIGAQDQLRTFGRLLGVPVHVAHDAGTLAEFLHLFMNKKLVLIDTVGVGQRDERLAELLSSLGSDSIKKLVVLNASAQAETIEDVITAYRADHSAGVVLSKLDEAVKTGGVLDCVIRHRLPVVGVANGQRVPEDWGLPDPVTLIDQALAQRPNSAFDLDDNEMAMLLAPEPLDGMSAMSAECGTMAHV